MEFWVFIAALTIPAGAIAYLAGRRKSMSRDNLLLTVGSVFVVLGVILGEDRLVGYSFIGAGVLLSIIGTLRNKKGLHVWRRTS